MKVFFVNKREVSGTSLLRYATYSKGISRALRTHINGGRKRGKWMNVDIFSCDLEAKSDSKR